MDGLLPKGNQCFFYRFKSDRVKSTLFTHIRPVDLRGSYFKRKHVVKN